MICAHHPSAKQATAMVAKLLSPLDDETNEWKRTQLRELAAINGARSLPGFYWGCVWF